MDSKAAYLNTKLPVADRVNDLVGRMTLDEKVGQMMDVAPAIERLGVPAYNWWNEGLHGVARAGFATVFPQAIGLAATWDRALIRDIATAISDEARAKYHDAIQHGNTGRYYGLTYWSPNINIFRDPRWGRGHETYGEDPYLTGEIGLQFVKGLQGDDPRHLKLVATPKHYAVHSGPEKGRHGFDAVVSRKEMEETYLPAFRKTIVQGKAHSIMGAYNRTNGEACCASHTLLDQILRKTWGFEGYVVSDCGAIGDIHRDHRLTATPEDASALAVKNGCDLNCGDTYHALRDAVAKGLITEAEIDVAVKRLFVARMKLGMFDPPAACRYSKTPLSVVNSRQHRALSLRAAQESIVLLKNDGVLPLNRKQIKTVAVLGPTANDIYCLLGNYNGSPSRPVTPLQGVMNALPADVKVLYERGSDVQRWVADGVPQAVNLARESDVVILCLGLTSQFEGEEGCAMDAIELAGDRAEIGLGRAQLELAEQVLKTGTPVVAVLLNGSAIAMPLLKEKATAIVEAWYPGEEGGTAIADVLFGNVNPAGRLPLTFYASQDQLPAFEDYRMQGRTYRYFEGEPLYPFGFGLSYTTFKYSSAKLAKKLIHPGEGVTLSVKVQNAGKRPGDEVVQVYVHPRYAPVRVPISQLVQFERVSIPAGKAKTVEFTLDAEAFSVVLEDGRRVVEPGLFDIYVSAAAPSAKGVPCVQTTLEILGNPVTLPGAF